MMSLEEKIPLNRSVAIKILEWCKLTYGQSKYKRAFPSLRYRNRPPYALSGAEKNEELYVYGIYHCDENYIYVDRTKHENLEDLVNTIIHEYTHYTQNMRYYYKIYNKYEKDIDKHPYEIKAWSVAERDTKKCIEQVFGSQN
jgi:hypothetical protein